MALSYCDNIKILNTRFSNNTSSKDGGALFIGYSTIIDIKNV